MSPGKTHATLLTYTPSFLHAIHVTSTLLPPLTPSHELGAPSCHERVPGKLPTTCNGEFDCATLEWSHHKLLMPQETAQVCCQELSLTAPSADLQVFLAKVDPNNTWAGLQRIVLNNKRVLWLCESCTSKIMKAQPSGGAPAADKVSQAKEAGGTTQTPTSSSMSPSPLAGSPSAEGS